MVGILRDARIFFTCQVVNLFFLLRHKFFLARICRNIFLFIISWGIFFKFCSTPHHFSNGPFLSPSFMAY